MKAIGYVRVSTEEQALNGVSLDAQEEKIKAYCIAKGWDLIRVVRDEGYSAKDLNRPGIQEIITGCKRKEFDVVTVLKLDRLTRSLKFMGCLLDDTFVKNGVALMCIQENYDTSNSNASSRMIINILTTLSEWERKIVSERTITALNWLKINRKRLGAVSYGFDCLNGKLSPNPNEVEVIKKMVILRKRGKSYQKIACHLNAKGIPSKNGGKWYPKTVMGVLKAFQSNPSYYQMDTW